jgi:hypothetical protein
LFLLASFFRRAKQRRRRFGYCVQATWLQALLLDAPAAPSRKIEVKADENMSSTGSLSRTHSEVMYTLLVLMRLLQVL